MSTDDSEILKKLEYIEAYLESIDSRVRILEGEKPHVQPIPLKVQKEPEKKQAMEREIGVKWFAWAGIAAVVLAAGFLILYAIQNNWISPVLQIMLGIAIGGVLLFAGHILEKKGLFFHSRVFFAGGFPVIFYSLFAAYQFYKMIPFEATALLITIVVAGAALLAYKKNSKTIAIESFLLGYLLPVITLKLDLFMLAYSLILFSGIIFLLKKKAWSVLYFGGFLANLTMYATWATSSIISKKFDPFYALVFLFLFFILFLIGSVFYSIRKDRFFFTTALLLCATAGFYFYMGGIVSANFLEYEWFFRAVFILAILPFVFLTKQIKDIHKIYGVLFLSFLAVALSSMLNISGIMVLGLAYAVLLSKYASGLNNTGLNNNEILILAWLSALLGFFYSLYSLLTFESVKFPQIWESTRLLSALVCIPAFYYLWAMSKGQTQVTKENGLEYVNGMYFGAASLFTLIFLTMEIQSFSIESMRSIIISIVWVLLAAFYIVIGFRFKLKVSRFTGICFFALASLKVLIFDLSGLDIVYRIISFFVLGVILLLSAFIYKKYEKQFD